MAQKNLRLDTADRVCLDVVRQYLPASSESAACRVAIRLLAEQMLAAYLAAARYPERQALLLAALNALTPPGSDGPVPAGPRYRIAPDNRTLLRRSPGRQTDEPVPLAFDPAG